MVDVAAYPGQQRTGASWIWVIILVLISLTLMISCYLIYDRLYMRTKLALTGLEKNIDESIAKIMEDDGRKVVRQAPPTIPVFGDDFFKDVESIVEGGLSYPKVMDIVGASKRNPQGAWKNMDSFDHDESGKAYSPAQKEIAGYLANTRFPQLVWTRADLDRVIAAIGKAQTSGNFDRALVNYDQRVANWIQKPPILENQPPADNLQDLLLAYKERVELLDKMLRTEIALRIRADEERRLALVELQNERNSKNKQVTALNKKLAEAEAKYQADRNRLRQEFDKKEAERKKFVAELRKANAEHDKYVKETDKKIADLNEEIRQLKLTKYVPPPPKEFDGQIVESVLEDQFAMIDIGEVDGVKKGMRYVVFEKGKAGRKVEKGLIEVKRVSEKVAYTGIVDQDRLNPIIGGDYVIEESRWNPSGKMTTTSEEESKETAKGGS